MKATLSKKHNVENEALDNKQLIFRFYEVMGYPLPLEKDFFAYHSKKKIWFSSHFSCFSRKEKSDIMNEFLAFLKKWKFLYCNFPFVEEIFLANSISFNALKENSDIDLFVITKQGRIWTARFIMSLILRSFWLKRTANNEYQRFCLSFFIDRKKMNLESLLLHEKDIYLPYWIAHLVPLYQEQKNTTLFEQNTWILRFLPNFPLQQVISLDWKIQEGKGKIKTCLEFLLSGKFWDYLEEFIRRIWKKRIYHLQNKNPELHHGVRVDKGILKFHYDKREKYSELFFSQK